MASQEKVRRVVSRLEEAVCESEALGGFLGESLKTPQKVHEVLAPRLQAEAVECFVCLMLDVKHRLFCYAEISRGTLTTSLVHPREVFGPALRMGAAAIIVAHNHPSGDPTPSKEDIAVTERLAKAGELLGIPLLDHVIIGAGTYESLASTISRVLAFSAVGMDWRNA